jgi:AcrR family transcriptional regulator
VKTSPREYRLNKRAQTQAETRERIIEAVVALHEEVGPARTTIVDIAERAQVSRPTVYSHFPDERALIKACSMHWAAANPRPDPSAWSQITDPVKRLRVALGELYDYYTPRERMLSNILRDAALVPSVAERVRNTIGPYSEAAAEILATGWKAPKRERRKLLAAIRLALHFQTWQTLTSSGLTNKDAVKLMTALVETAYSG